MTHKPIPVIRKRLYQLADELGVDELRQLADATYRKPPVRKAPSSRSGKLSVEQMDQIDHLAVTFPHMAMREIGRRIGADQGRVSEYLTGKVKRPQLELTT